MPTEDAYKIEGRKVHLSRQGCEAAYVRFPNLSPKEAEIAMAKELLERRAKGEI